MHILIVEDVPATRLYMCSLLSGYGHKVSEAENGAEAWDMLIDSDIQLVISDWMMPEVSGLDLCKLIRSEQMKRYVYVIMVTGKTSYADLLEGMGAGADDFITKPFNANELQVRVDAASRVLTLQQQLQERNQNLDSTNTQLQKAQTEMRQDLEAAASMQQSLLPGYSKIRNLQLHSLFRPAAIVAGDIYNYHRLDDSHLGFYLADVSGHSVSSAMLSFTLNKTLSASTSAGNPMKHEDMDNPGKEKITSPAELMEVLNERFQDDSGNMLYFTMIYGVINMTTGHGELCQAGHPNPIHVASSGAVRSLGHGGFPVGLIPDAEYENIQFKLCAGDRLFLYSDGISDHLNEDNSKHQKWRIRRVLCDMRVLSVPIFLKRLKMRLKEWSGDRAPADDMSLLAIEFGAQKTG